VPVSPPAALLLLSLWAAPYLAFAQVQVVPPAAGASAAAKPGAAKATASKAAFAKPITKPLWTELTPAQRQALAPLAPPQWDTVSEAQKRKWLALSENYPKMSGAEQAKLHSRMSDWVALSPQQRTQARLNFGETKQIPADDKKAKWEAYQALPPEEKRKLAAGAPKPPATAAAVKPVPAEKLATVPKSQSQTRTRQQQTPPRVATAPNQVDHNTLLPQQGASPVSAPN
jgi:hypothetical protein